MKRSILNDTSIVNTSDIYEDLATAMNFKIKMGTALDDEKIFHNDNNYEPS